MHRLNQINTNENALPISLKSLKKVLRTKIYAPPLHLCITFVPFISPPRTDYGEMNTPLFLSHLFLPPPCSRSPSLSTEWAEESSCTPAGTRTIPEALFCYAVWRKAFHLARGFTTQLFCASIQIGHRL